MFNRVSRHAWTAQLRIAAENSCNSGTQEDRRLFLKLLEDARTEALRCGATVEEVGPAGSPGIAFWTFIHLLRLQQTKQLDLHFETLQDFFGCFQWVVWHTHFMLLYCNEFMIIIMKSYIV